MKSRRIVALIVVVLGFARPSPAAEQDCQHSDTAFRCVRYIRNYDADTITVEIPGVHPLLGKDAHIRVRGVDTPEVRGKNPCEKDKSRSAADFVAARLKAAKRIDLENVARDKYFRILADVKIDGRSLTDELLTKGLAYAYEGQTKQAVNWCTFSPGKK